MSRFTNALARRRAELKDREGGFTLVELLVVVIIIGILAAIAIPIYIGIQNGAKDAGVKSDLTNAKTAVISYFVDHPDGTGLALDDATLGEYGFTKGDSVDTTAGDIAFSGTAPGDSAAHFCITATSTSGQDFFVSDKKGVNDSGC